MSNRVSPCFLTTRSLADADALNAGSLGPDGAAMRDLPDDAQHKPLEKVQPAWRGKIANLKILKSVR